MRSLLLASVPLLVFVPGCLTDDPSSGVTRQEWVVRHERTLPETGTPCEWSMNRLQLRMIKDELGVYRPDPAQDTFDRIDIWQVESPDRQPIDFEIDTLDVEGNVGTEWHLNGDWRNLGPEQRGFAGVATQVQSTPPGGAERCASTYEISGYVLDVED
jgi:hypothetical protein